MTLNLHWPQLIYLALLVSGTLIIASRHGQPKTGKHDLGHALLADVIVIALLYWGGFFG